MPPPLPRPGIELEHEDEVTSSSFMSDDTILATTSDYMLALWDTPTAEEARARSGEPSGDYGSIAAACYPGSPSRQRNASPTSSCSGASAPERRCAT